MTSPPPAARRRRLPRRRRRLRSVSGTTVWSPRRRRLTIGLMLTVATAAFESLAVNTVLPAANAQLHDLHHYGMVFSAFLLTQLVGVVVGGRLADGPRPQLPFVAGTVLFSAGLIVTGTASTMLILACGRALQGLGAGAVGGLAIYAVRRCYEESARPRMVALLSTAYVVPGLAGPALAAGIADLAGWRWVFLGLVPVMPIAALMAIPVIRITALDKAVDEKQKAAARPLGWSIVALMGAVASALTGLAVTDHTAEIAAAAVAGVLGVPALGHALPRGTLWLRSGQPAAVAFILFAGIAYFSTEAFLPLSLISVHRSTILEAGLILSTGTVFWNAGTWVQARMVKVINPQRLLIAGSALLAVGIGATGYLMTTAALPAILVTPAWAVVALGMGLTSSTATIVVLGWADEGSEGNAASSAQLANLLGGAIGTGVAGLKIASASAVSSLVTDVRVVAAAAGTFAVLGGLAALRARARGWPAQANSLIVAQPEEAS